MLLIKSSSKAILLLIPCIAVAVTLAVLPREAFSGSPAKAPVLDQTLKRAIGKMTPLNGKKIPALDNRGLIIAFFASWCPPCRPEFAELNTLRQMYSPDDVSIVAINLFEDFFNDDSGLRMKRFLGKTRPEFTTVRASNDAFITQSFGGVDRIPTLYVYDRTGQPVYTFIHQKGAAKTHATALEIAPQIQKFLSKPIR